MNSRLAELFASISTAPTSKGPVTHLIVGLGNPGKQYENNRHNVGFHAIDELAKTHRIDMKSARFQALVGDGQIGNTHVLLMKPQTYMNLSGDAVKAAADYYKIPAERVIVFCDDISFEPGQMRIRRKGSAGGHNGLKSIIARLGGDEFPRIKIGVGKKPHPDYDLADWVLGRCQGEDKKAIDAAVKKAADAIECILSQGLDKGMNRFNG